MATISLFAIFVLFPSLIESATSKPPRDLIGHYLRAHNDVVLVSATLSLVGCLFIVGSYILWKEIRTPSRSILVFISLADLLSVSSNISGITSHYNQSQNDTQDLSQHNVPECCTEAAINTFGSVSSFLWTVTLAVYLYIALVKDDIGRGNWLMYRVFSPLCWGIPLIITITGTLTHGLGFDNDYLTSGWCWVRVKNASDIQPKEIAWMFIAGKGWEILAYFIIAGLYIRIIITIKREVSPLSRRFRMPSEIEAMKKATLKMMLIPVVFVLLRIWGTIRFAWFLLNSHPEDINPTVDILLIFLHGIGDTAQGWANCLLFFCFTRKVRSKLKDCFKTECTCCYHKGSSKNKKRHTLNDRSADFPAIFVRSESENPALLHSKTLEQPYHGCISGKISSRGFHERSSLVQNEVT